MRKIGVMGGTFNPIHNGHLEIAQAAKDYLILDEVWFMPAGDPPHKDDNIVSKEKRTEMVKLAIYGEEGFFLSTHEIDKERVSYSAITFKEFSETYTDCEFYFIMGADSFVNFENWYHPEEISKYTEIAVCSRNEVDKETLEEKTKLLSEKYGTKTTIIPFNEINISSSVIREAFKNGDEDEIKEYLNSDVYNFIVENELYSK